MSLDLRTRGFAPHRSFTFCSNVIPRSILTSDAWSAVKAHLASEILALRERNDSKLQAEDTAHIRGQLHALKDLLALSDQPPEKQAQEPPMYDS